MAVPPPPMNANKPTLGGLASGANNYTPLRPPSPNATTGSLIGMLGGGALNPSPYQPTQSPTNSVRGNRVAGGTGVRILTPQELEQHAVFQQQQQMMQQNPALASGNKYGNLGAQGFGTVAAGAGGQSIGPTGPITDAPMQQGAQYNPQMALQNWQNVRPNAVNNLNQMFGQNFTAQQYAQMTGPGATGVNGNNFRPPVQQPVNPGGITGGIGVGGLDPFTGRPVDTINAGDGGFGVGLAVVTPTGFGDGSQYTDSTRTKILPPGGGGAVPANQYTPQGQGGAQQPPTPNMTTPQGQVPQYGLIGYENAIQNALGGGLGMLEGGLQAGLGSLDATNAAVQQQIGGALGLLGGAFGQGAGALNDGLQQALGQFGGAEARGAGAIQGGANQALNFLRQGMGGALGFLQQGGGAGAGSASAVTVDPNTGQRLFREASQGVNQFTDAGVRAQQQQLALSGALGQEAFNNALMNNPATQFLREQGQEAIINQQAALGGLGGGNVMRELSRFNQGLAAQDLDNQFNRAAALSNQGLQAAGQSGQFLSQGAQQMGNLASTNAQLGTQTNIANAGNQTQASIANANLANQRALAGANLLGDLSRTGAGISANAGQNIGQLAQTFGQLGGQASLGTGQNLAQLAQMFGQTGAGLMGRGADTTAQLGSQGAGMQFNAGNTALQALINAGQGVGGARLGAGQQIAGNIGQTIAGLGNLQNQQGISMADILGGNAGIIAQLINQSGTNLGNNQMNLATILANLATGQGSQIAQLQGLIGGAGAAGQTGQANAISGLLNGIISAAGMAMSDSRLKSSITKISELKNGLNWYEWTWNGLLGLKGKAQGVIAQEVLEVMPNAVVETASGYLAVNYGEVLRDAI